jgi:hypothetical protein
MIKHCFELKYSDWPRTDMPLKTEYLWKTTHPPLSGTVPSTAKYSEDEWKKR